MWRKKIGVLIQTIAILALAACSVGADLEFIQTQSDRISITGEICSQDPFSITSPVNISIVIDVSGSMATTDPSLFRVSAAQQVVNKYLPKENYKFQIIKFSNAAENLTSGFTRDPTIINSAIGALSQADGGTNYQDAFNSTRSGIEQEIIDLEDNQGSAATAYFPILFLSDGVPTLPSGNPQGNAISALNLLMGIKNIYTIGDLRLHAAFLGAANSAGYIFMQQVAAIGLGIFLHFQNASDISFLDQGIDLEPLHIPYSLVNLFVLNMNAISGSVGNSGPTILPDSDMDGLPDYRELELGTNPLNPDTDGDNTRDGVEILRLSNPLVQDSLCPGGSNAQDQDLDGLTDCEEAKLFTDEKYFDTDEDGIPDLLEVIRGTDPTIPDVSLDPDSDGRPNVDEIKRNLNPNYNDNSILETYGYQHSLNFVGINADGLYCYNAEYHNISLVPTLSLSGQNASNEIWIYLIQRPLDGSTDKNTVALGKIIVDVTAFYQNLGDFNNEVHWSQIPFEYLTPVTP
ncbi:MAG: VWA domain-containing protein [Bdellovibrionales bacterium]|nr:VWA domain-containing protein [Bdellovibrionales bacterium]